MADHRTRRPADHRNGGAQRPLPLSPFQAVVAHPFLTLLPILLMVGGAIAFGLTREPTWTSEARLSVGELTPSTQSAPGIVEPTNSWPAHSAAR